MSFAKMLLLPCFLLAYSPVFAVDTDVSSGPLKGKLLDAVHQTYYCFPGFSAREGNREGLVLESRSYYSNEFRGYTFNPDYETLDADGRLSESRAEELTAMDYESLVLEAGISRQFGAHHRMGLTFRLYSYYGGVFDPVIEGFHSLFHLPNASREYFPQGGATISVQNSNGVQIEQQGAGILLGDTEVYGIRTLYENRDSALALAWALELPTGSKGTPAGNGYIDTGLQILWERALGKSFVLHLQQGLVIPGELLFSSGEADPYPISQSMAAFEWRPEGFWSYFLQTRINSSPLRSDAELNHSLFTWADQFELPVTSLLVGARYIRGPWEFQCYFEEDALTHEGPDILVSFSAVRKIR